MIDPVAAERHRPATVDEISAILRDADTRRAAVKIQGGNTLASMGYPLERCDVELDMSAFNAFMLHEVHDLTCAVASGKTLRAFADALAANGQFVPLDAPLAAQATVGGTLAGGWRGPRRHLFGAARDLLIGVEAVLADGTPVRSGGMVVKNVAGYDMGKLYTGSFGTLAVLTRANFKAMPVPERARAVIARLPERTRARAIAQLQSLPVVPAAAFVVEGFRDALDGEDGIDGRLFVLLQGSASVVDRATRDLRSALGRAGVPEAVLDDTGAANAFQRVLDATIETVGERSVTYRAYVPPSEADSRAAALRDIAVRHQFLYDCIVDAMNGDVFLRVKDRDARAFDSRIEIFDDELHAAEPFAAVVASRSAMRAHLQVWGARPGGLEKMRALKERFDPNRTLNPGRFVGSL